MIIVTISAFPLAWVAAEMKQRRREQQVIAWIEVNGGRVSNNSSYVWSQHAYQPPDEKPWTDRMLGDSVRGVFFPTTEELNVSDLTPLTKLKNLETLGIDARRAGDLAWLETLTKLKVLLIHVPDGADLTPLTKLRELKGLNLRNSGSSDVTPLASLKKLKVLGLGPAYSRVEEVELLREALPKCHIDYYGEYYGEPNAGE